MIVTSGIYDDVELDEGSEAAQHRLVCERPSSYCMRTSKVKILWELYWTLQVVFLRWLGVPITSECSCNTSVLFGSRFSSYEGIPSCYSPCINSFKQCFLRVACLLGRVDGRLRSRWPWQCRCCDDGRQEQHFFFLTLMYSYAIQLSYISRSYSKINIWLFCLKLWYSYWI